MQNYLAAFQITKKYTKFWGSKVALDVRASPPAPRLRRAGKPVLLAKNL